MTQVVVALVGSAGRLGIPYLEGRLDPGWSGVEFGKGDGRENEAIAAVGVPGAIRWKEQFSDLRFLQLTGAGTDDLDPSSLPKNCLVSNVYEHEGSIAEYVFTGCNRRTT